MKLPSARWPVLLLMLLICGGAVLLVIAYPPAPDRYALPFTEIDCGPLPPYVPADFLQDVRRRCSLPETLDTRQPQLLAQLHATFRDHPRVRDVTQVRLASSRRIVVELRFREPVALVLGEPGWPVDAQGVLLPPLPGPAVTDLLPIEGVKERATVAPGQPWPAVLAAAATAAKLRHDRDTLHIAAVTLSNDPLQPTVQLRTTRGSIILWRDLRSEDTSDPEDKLRLLRDYVTRYSSLDAPDGPYRFDVRIPVQGLLRQPIVPVRKWDEFPTCLMPAGGNSLPTPLQRLVWLRDAPYDGNSSVAVPIERSIACSENVRVTSHSASCAPSWPRWPWWWRNWPVSIAHAAPNAAPVQTEDEKQWNATVDKAIAFLRKSQAEDGSFSKDKNIGITGVVLAGLLETGRVDVNDPMVVKALGFIKSLVNTKDGHIAGQDPKNQLKNYVTAVNVLALAAANKQNGKFNQEVAMAAKFLKELQWDEGEKTAPDNLFYGGFGYDSKNRPDLSNSQIALDALNAAGVPTDDPAMKNARMFVSRCQNFQSEFQDQPWAAKVNDGSFIYSPAETKNDPGAGGALPGYGSMTYAGIKSLIYAGVAKNDKRVLAAMAWIRKNYTVEANPGLPAARSQQGLYYYYHTMAKCMDVLGVEDFVDDKGAKHNWRQDITQALAKRQLENGSWGNKTSPRWFEDDPNLVTGYALMALSHTEPKK